jgi:hypothetical protein
MSHERERPRPRPELWPAWLDYLNRGGSIGLLTALVGHSEGYVRKACERARHERTYPRAADPLSEWERRLRESFRHSEPSSPVAEPDES